MPDHRAEGAVLVLAPRHLADRDLTQAGVDGEADQRHDRQDEDVVAEAGFTERVQDDEGHPGVEHDLEDARRSLRRGTDRDAASDAGVLLSRRFGGGHPQGS